VFQPKPSSTSDSAHDSSRARNVAVGWRQVTSVVAGVILSLLGLLWILQGADVVRIQPILCVADCQPITGGSPGWLATGVVTLAVGLTVMLVPWWRRRRAM
jgi:hypothetical protein